MLDKSKNWVNVLLLYFKVLVGKEMAETSHKRTFDSSEKRITLSFAPGDAYLIDPQDIALAKEAESNLLAVISPYTPVTHEELVIFQLGELIKFLKSTRQYTKVSIEGKSFLKISYDDVCDLAIFMRTLR